MTTLTGPSVDLNQLLSGTQLPALPQSAMRLFELAKDPENGSAEFAVPIESDPGLTGQILRFVNSSYFGFSREVSSVQLAITLVGIRTIKNFVLWSAVFSLMPNAKCRRLDVKVLWQDSLRRGLFARVISKALGLCDSEELFAAALLQDMALPLLAKELPDDYATLLEARCEEKIRLSALEQARFGWTHADAAGVIARGWNLPDQFAVLVENHTQAVGGGEQDDRSPGQVGVALSALLPSLVDETWEEFPEFDALFRQVCGPDSLPAKDVLGLVDGQFDEFAPILQVAAPTRSLVSYHDEVMPPTS